MTSRTYPPSLKPRQRLDKYRLVRHLAKGGFANVFEAYDTIEGTSVALKIPHAQLIDKAAIASFRKEVRITATLDHPNILPIKNASFLGDLFVVVYPLGEKSLGDRLAYRISSKRALNFTEQMLSAVAYAHRHRVLHCDIKPDNMILFRDDRLRLTDFGLAKVAQRTVCGSGGGTVGYMAPEQALGTPSLRSDVFSLGLVIWELFTGELPQWPFHWPQTGYDRLKTKVHPAFIEVLQRALTVDPSRRFASADEMYRAFLKVRGRALSPKRRKKRIIKASGHWKKMLRREFLRQHGRELNINSSCKQCGGPISEAMQSCPWCSHKQQHHGEDSSFPRHCPRCHRGVKADWKYCAWCYGGAIQTPSTRSFTDKRYVGRCGNPRCERKHLMPFMRYCPWCNAKVKKGWTLSTSRETCGRCGWGVLREFWRSCPWCSVRLKQHPH